MKSKAQRRDRGADGRCRGNDPGTSSEVGGGGQNLRRSTRKRSAPVHFVTQPKRNAGYWSMREKEKLLAILNEVNSREIANLYAHRYPIKLIRKKIGSKSCEEVKRYLADLERRGAASAWSQMKQQTPLESWRQMSDQMALLTSDESHRHLIRVCSLMALESTSTESKDTSPDNSGDCSSKVDTDPVVTSEPTTAATESTAATPEAPSPTAAPASLSPAQVGSTRMPASCAPSTTSAPTTAPSATGSPACASQGTPPAPLAPVTAAAPTCSLAAPATVAPAATPAPASVESAPAATVTPTTTVPTAAPLASAPESGQRAPAPEKAPAPSAEAEQRRSADKDEVPDYASIYKYIGSLMRGEVKELGPLESLVVLDCLKLVERHLRGRDNNKQREFVQDRLLDIVNNFYLSVDAEDNRIRPAALQDEFAQPVTMDEMLAAIGQSEPGAIFASRSGTAPGINGPATPEVGVAEETTTTSQSEAGQSAISQSASQWESGPSALEMVSSSDVPAPSSAANVRPLRGPIGLGSLNPFNVPLSLLDIRSVE